MPLTMALGRPLRGEIWLASLGAARFGELGKSRPVIILSEDGLFGGDPRDLVVVVPTSSSVADSPLRPPVPASAGLDRDSVAVCRSVRAIAASRLLHRVGHSPPETLSGIESALKRIVALA